MHAENLWLWASSSLACSVVAIAVSPAVSAAEDDKACEVFALRHCDVNATIEALKPLMASPNASPEAVRIETDEKQNRVIVYADSDNVKRVAAVLSELEREAEKRQRSAETEPTTIPELDAEEMTDAQLRQAVVALSKQVKELTSRIQRLEEAQRLRIVPLESGAASANDMGYYARDEITPPGVKRHAERERERSQD